MTQGRYALAPVFCIRAAGVPFDRLEALGTPAVAAAARRALETERAVDDAGDAAIAHAGDALGKDQRAARKVIKRLVKSRRPLTDEQRADWPWLASYEQAAVAHALAVAELERVLDDELRRVHREVRRHAVEVLPDFAVIESEAMLDELAAIAAAPPLAAGEPLRGPDREKDRSLAMYLQRVCSKSDTISKFGPSGWGRIVEDLTGMRLAPAGITARCLEVERWVVTGVIEVMNADAAIRAEVCPRRHPDAALDGDTVTRVDTGAQVQLAAGDGALVARCDGHTPAHALGDPAALARLVEAGVLVWELERYAVDVSPLASLIADVEAWRDDALRARWLAPLVRLRDLARAFGDAADVAQRRRVLADFRAELAQLGVAERDRGRTLYAAANPISENLYREYGFDIGAAEGQRLVTAATPWFDFFRDAYALAVARAFTKFHALVVDAPRPRGRLSYAELVAFAKTRGLEIENDKLLLQTGVETFAEIKRALAAQLGERADGPVWALTADDCGVLRRLHDLPEVAELAYPQADLQLAAASVDDVVAGRATWVVAELHHAFMQLQHVMYWGCPDKPALHRAMAAATAHQPFVVRGSLTEQPVHVGGESVFWALPQPTFVGRGRPKRGWRAVHRADAEVIVDEARRDVRLRDPGSGEDLGSLIRAFRLMMGMHPFFPFERAPHAPRLVLDGVVVQRQTWHVSSAELGEPRPVGLSPELVVAVERLRRDRGIPRWVFARASLGKSFDVYARDKDMKPFYLDLESALFLDIFERRLRKYGELVFSEMLPAPDQLVWSEPAGRVVFELRTSIVPAATR